MALRPTKGDEDDVADELVRAVFALLRTQSCEREKAFTRVFPSRRPVQQ